MPRKDLEPVIQLHQMMRKELLALHNKYPSIVLGDADIGPEGMTKVEFAFCKLLWEIDEEVRRLAKFK